MIIRCLKSTDESINIDIKNKIKAMDNEMFPFPWNDKQWDEVYGDLNSVLCLAQENETLYGFALFQVSVYENLAHLYKIVVSPERRKNKVAFKILNISENFLKPQNIERCFLEVAVNNTSAIQLYKSSGYEVLNTIKGFYSNGDDAYAMQKSL